MYLYTCRFILISIIFFVQIQMAIACRFNVRETGFVDLETEKYLLIVYSR